MTFHRIIEGKGKWSQCSGFPFIRQIYSRRSRQRRQEDLSRIIARDLASWRCSRKDWPRWDLASSSIKYKSRIQAYRPSHFSISKSILVYSLRIRRDRSGNLRIRNAIHTYFSRDPPRKEKFSFVESPGYDACLISAIFNEPPGIFLPTKFTINHFFKWKVLWKNSFRKDSHLGWDVAY